MNSNSPIAPSGMELQEDWHNGTDFSTSEFDLTYLEFFHEGSATYTQRMWIDFKDDTQSEALFDMGFMFESGGINSTHVINWSKMTSSAPGFSYGGAVGTEGMGSYVQYEGFMIVNGTADDVELVLNDQGDIWQWLPKNASQMASLTYRREASFNNSTDWNITMKIGEVNWTTRDYTYEERSLKESIIRFNVSINAIISDTFDSVHIPVVLEFRVTHNITKNTWKYGADIDWSAVKDFPCRNELSTGDNFSLIARDRIVFAYSPDVKDAGVPGFQISNYSTNAENDTAIFSIGGVEYGREYITKNYLINGTEFHNTTRIYIQNATHAPDVYFAPYASQTFVIFDGFKYNQSLGFEFDPFVVVPCSEVPGDAGIPWTGLLFQLLGVLALVTVAFNIKRKTLNKPEVL